MCETCKSRKLIEFRPEVWVRLLGPDSETVDLPVYPRFTLCLECGATDFTLPEREMELLREAVRRDFQLLRGAAAGCL